MKKWHVMTALAVMVVLMVFLAGCEGGSGGNGAQDSDNVTNIGDNGVLPDTGSVPSDNQLPIDFEYEQLPQPPIEPLSRWLPDKTFTALIWGEYIIESDSYERRVSDRIPEDVDDFLSDMKFEPMSTKNHVGDEVSILPIKINAGMQAREGGSGNDLYKLYQQGYGFLNYYVYSKAGQASERQNDIIFISMPYVIRENKIVMMPEWEWNYEEEDNNRRVETGNFEKVYTINEHVTIEIEFYFDGRDLVLSRDGLQVKLKPEPSMWEGDSPRYGISTLNYRHPSTPKFNEITHFSYYRPDSYENRIVFDENYYMNASAVRGRNPRIILYDNGIIYLSYEGRTDHYSNDLVEIWGWYIYCGRDGIILVDEYGKCYPFNIASFRLKQAVLSDSLDNVDVENIGVSEVEQLLQVHSEVLENLETAFSKAGIEANIDPITGRVTMDTSILFDVNEFQLSDIGKAYLDGFLDVYASVVLSDAYTGSIAKILVEGHTDSNGTREQNQTLSEKRAGAVVEYCLIRQSDLAEIIVAKGYGFDQVVYDEHGNEDHAASRRVVFKFILNT